MPRGMLTERYVQKVAIDWLEGHYQSLYQPRSIVGNKEMVVRPGTKIGSGRADGLIVAKLHDGRILAAALEAKSSRTLFNLGRWYRDLRWLAHAMSIGSFATIVSVLLTWRTESWFVRWILPLLVFLSIGFLFVIITSEHHLYQGIDVIQQVKRYPANERWIALSVDAYKKLGDEMQQSLQKSCRREGIGLLQVGRNGNVKRFQDPQMKSSHKGYADYLACYAREDKIRKMLDEAVSAE